MKLPGTLALIVLLGACGCSQVTNPETDPSDPCVVRTGDRDRPSYAMNVEILASGDSVPLIDWTPADCGVARVVVYGNSAIGRGDRYLGPCHFDITLPLWDLRTTNPWSGRRGSPNIHPPIRYGVVPPEAVWVGGTPFGLPTDTSAFVAPPLAFGDTLAVWLYRPWQDLAGCWHDAVAIATLVVGQGIIQR
jgi:hypothetical protein